MNNEKSSIRKFQMHCSSLFITELESSQPQFPATVPCEHAAFLRCFKPCPYTPAAGSLSALFFENYLPYASRPFFCVQPLASSCLGGIKATSTENEAQDHVFLQGCCLLPQGLWTSAASLTRTAIFSVTSLQFTCLLKVSSLCDCSESNTSH